MTPAKFYETVRYELWYQARGRATWLFVLALTPVVYQATAQEIANAAGGGTPVNAPFVLAMITRLGSALALLPIAVVAGEAAARDVTTRMTPLQYTAPVGRSTYLGGRLVAALVLAALASAAVPLGILLGLLGSGATPDLLGPLRPATHAAAWAFVALPNAVVAAAFAFAAATAARRPMAAWAASAALPVASLLCALLLAGSSATGRSPHCSTRSGSRRSRRCARGGPPTRSGPACRGSRRAGCGTARSGCRSPRRGRPDASRLPVHAPRGCRTTAARRRAARAGRAAAPRAAEAPAAARYRARTFGPGTHARQVAAVAGESWRVVVWGGAGS
jgi:hypothetical protein